MYYLLMENYFADKDKDKLVSSLKIRDAYKFLIFDLEFSICNIILLYDIDTW